MTVHVIRLTDRAGIDLGEIRWNDETGEVSGDNDDAPRVRAAVEAFADGGETLREEGLLRVRDPRRDPADFLAITFDHIIGTDRVALPPALRGVEPTAWIRDLPDGEVG